MPDDDVDTHGVLCTSSYHHLGIGCLFKENL